MKYKKYIYYFFKIILLLYSNKIFYLKANSIIKNHNKLIEKDNNNFLSQHDTALVVSSSNNQDEIIHNKNNIYKNSIKYYIKLIRQYIKQKNEKKILQAKQLLEEKIKISDYYIYPELFYYKGLIYEELSKKKSDDFDIKIQLDYLDTAITNYTTILKVFNVKSQYYSFVYKRLEQLFLFYLNKGIRCYESDLEDNAIEYLTISQKIKPNNPLIYLYRGIVEHKINNYQLAIKNYQQYLFLGGNNINVYYTLAELFYNQIHDNQKALEIINEGLLQQPYCTYLYQIQSTIYIKNQQINKEIELLNEKIKFTICLLNNNKKEIELINQLSIYYYQLSQFYFFQNDYYNAITYALAAENYRNDIVEINMTLGMCYYKQAYIIFKDVQKNNVNLLPQEIKIKNESLLFYLKKSLHFLLKVFVKQPNNIEVLQMLKNIYAYLDMDTELDAILLKIEDINNAL